MTETYAAPREIAMIRQKARDLATLIRREQESLDSEQERLNERRARLTVLKRDLGVIQARLGPSTQRQP